jgi:anti-anti-sigma factor
MQPRFGLSRSVHDGTATVTVSGDVGPDAAAKLGYAIVAAVNDHRISQVVVDLSRVDSIDQSGLNALVAGQRAARLRQCTLQIASPSPSVIDAALTGLRRTDRLREHTQDAVLRFFSAQS